jgi:superfamily II DNA/RNA helicase
MRAIQYGTVGPVVLDDCTDAELESLRTAVGRDGGGGKIRYIVLRVSKQPRVVVFCAQATEKISVTMWMKQLGLTSPGRMKNKTKLIKRVEGSPSEALQQFRARSKTEEGEEEEEHGLAAMRGRRPSESNEEEEEEKLEKKTNKKKKRKACADSTPEEEEKTSKKKRKPKACAAAKEEEEDGEEALTPEQERQCQKIELIMESTLKKLEKGETTTDELLAEYRTAK